MSKITITVKDKEGIEFNMVLREPGFSELSLAYNAYLSGFAAGKTGMPDIPKAGKILIDLCAIEAETDKAFYDSRSELLMFSAAIKAAEIVEVFDAELKKN
jgi:hypothetical protein